jgi:hypothetical protein
VCIFFDINMKRCKCSFRDRGAAVFAFTLMVLVLGGVFADMSRAQLSDEQIEARARLFPDVGPGVRAIRSGNAGRYYILSAPGAAIAIYARSGQREGQLPENPAKDSAIVYGEDFDMDSSGRIYVADRGANAVKVFSSDGTLAMKVPIAAPTSVASLSGGEMAVASLRANRLVEILDAQGKKVRDFGDRSDLAEHAELNRFLNIGRLLSDSTGNLYYGFTYLPEPTVRKYDRYGYAAMEISLRALEYQPPAQAARREIWRQDQHSGAPHFKPVINALGVDPQSQEIWVALGDELVHFDRDGIRHTSYRSYTVEGARVEPVAILVEADRLILAADPLGIFEFARPDKAAPGTTQH